MKRVLSMVSLLGLILFAWAGQASANIVYNFSGVTFSDGGTLTGTMTTNDAMNALVDFDITTSPATGLGFNYTSASIGSSSTSLPFILVLSDIPSPTNILQVTFNNLTTAGAPITIGTFDSFEQNGLARRDIVAGGVVAVPEPSTFVLLGIGALGLLGYRLRRGQV